MKYKVGDSLKIVKNIHGHDFAIGEVVTVGLVRETDYDCTNGKTDWYVTDKEVRPVINNPPSYLETYYEVVSALSYYEHQGKSIKARAEQGIGGMYELAKSLTDEFEELNKGREWDGEFFEEIEEFMTKKSLEFLVP